MDLRSSLGLQHDLKYSDTDPGQVLEHCSLRASAGRSTDGALSDLPERTANAEATVARPIHNSQNRPTEYGTIMHAFEIASAPTSSTSINR